MSSVVDGKTTAVGSVAERFHVEKCAEHTAERICNWVQGSRTHHYTVPVLCTYKTSGKIIYIFIYYTVYSDFG